MAGGRYRVSVMGIPPSSEVELVEGCIPLNVFTDMTTGQHMLTLLEPIEERLPIEGLDEKEEP